MPALPPFLRRPAPAPYFHPFFNFSDFPCSKEANKIYFPLFKGKGGGGVWTMLPQIAATNQLDSWNQRESCHLKKLHKVLA